MNIAIGSLIATQLTSLAEGKTITSITANQNPHTFVWFATTPSRAFTDASAAVDFAPLLVGKKIDRITVNTGGYGFFNFIHIGNRALICDIVPLYTAPGGKIPKRHQLMIELDDGRAITYSASLGGAVFLFETDENGDAVGYKSDFPLVNTDGFSYDFFKGIIKQTEGKAVSVKQLLATKNRIPGIDNNLLQDILFEARVNPKTKVTALSEEEIVRIFTAIKTIPGAIIASGGKDVDKDVFGKLGGFASAVSRNTVGKPCARCGDLIVKEAYLGGSVFYCPSCQKFS
jgi:Formamidopyrimidine-DNA glycosylase